MATAIGVGGLDRGEASYVSATAPVRVPSLRRITVLYDAACPLCVAVSGWLARQPKLIPIDLISAGSARARNRYPELDHARTLREVTVIGDAGQVYTGAYAWIMCLWALYAYRPMSYRLATPAGLPVAKAAVVAAAKISSATRREAGDCGDDCGPHD
ncbi:thiol-disulfide oxidoreductase DCC family protein [Yinghuangia seranimata]|uniref:thiol-disulfide oxidoreductase DCC family protein n=1 Tax=Yinghuangia seranimata TaxID=408067 RepID=UPI00248C7844|nr:DCC1-like thiol-disulfide oxidoreductase family protein [Yinghuangia seranimata]MDI2128442.1 DCC1-like thiol-disulfide oxidoreductase family protein [Yinghuangia seranimata]